MVSLSYCVSPILNTGLPWSAPVESFAPVACTRLLSMFILMSALLRSMFWYTTLELP